MKSIKVNGENGLGSLLKIFLQICFALGIIIIIILPFALKKLNIDIKISVAIIYPNGTILLLIMHEFIKLFKSLKNNNPFCDENVKTLKTTGRISFIGALIWCIDLIIYVLCAKDKNIVTILTFTFMTILFIGVFVALYILSELFKEAVDYKKENELTI